MREAFVNWWVVNRIFFYKVAEQALTSNCGTDLKFRVFGNAPSGYQIKNYGREKREETKLNGHKVSTSDLPFFVSISKGLLLVSFYNSSFNALYTGISSDTSEQQFKPKCLQFPMSLLSATTLQINFCNIWSNTF